MYENYERALKLGKREYNNRKSRRESPYLPVLDEIAPNASSLPTRPLHLVSIPINQIVGTATRGRTTAFAANFMPLIENRSEFGNKWERLYESVIDQGVNIPIKAIEYMNQFYVVEGNKRVSVMKFLGAVAIEGEVTRLIPPPTEDLTSKIYYEFLSFYNDSEVNYVWFSRTGGYAKLYEHMDRTPGERWSTDTRHEFHSAYMRFANCYHRLEGDKLSITTGDAFLIFLEIYGYTHACEAFGDAYQDDVRAVWEEFRLSAQEERVVMLMEPTVAIETPSFFSSFMTPKKLRAAFLYNRTPSESGWTYWHEMGRCHVDALLEGRVETITREAQDDEAAEQALRDLIVEGSDVIFTTSPVFLNAAIKASVENPEVKILNCSLLASFHHVRSYYLRMYEAKFIIGAIAGALADNNRIGYVAEYPIYGTPSSINAFALGARLVNPRAQIYLEWSMCRDRDPYATFRENDVNIICNRDIGAPGHGTREFGLYKIDPEGFPNNLAMPVWNWGRLYETILRSALNGSWKNAGEAGGTQALGYWPGISTGAIDVFYSQRLPSGTRHLTEILKSQFQSGTYNPFYGKIVSQDGTVHTQEDEELSPARIIAMNWLCDNVLGSIPELAQLRPEAHPLVRLQGIYDSARPDPSAFAWTGMDSEGPS